MSMCCDAVKPKLNMPFFQRFFRTWCHHTEKVENYRFKFLRLFAHGGEAQTLGLVFELGSYGVS